MWNTLNLSIGPTHVAGFRELLALSAGFYISDFTFDTHTKSHKTLDQI